MATIDLGKIKLLWRGTYNNSTAYAVDDVVEYTDTAITSSYICTTASTGNAPSSGGTAHGSWAYMAKGAAGSPTTTEGDVIYRGASADARLAKGTAGQVLKMNTGATAPEWAADSGGLVLLGSGTGGGSSSINIDNVFTADYKHYKFVYSWTEDDWVKFRWLKADGSEASTSEYGWSGIYTSTKWSDNSKNHDHYGNKEVNYAPLHYWEGQDNSPGGGEVIFLDPCNANTDGTFVGTFYCDDGTYNYFHAGGSNCRVENAFRGIHLWGNGGDNMTSTNFFWSMYGFSRT